MRNTNIAIEYDYYTLDQARKIIAAENHKRAKKIARRKARRKAMLIQKVAGLLLIGCGAIVLLMEEPDKTPIIPLLGVGTWLLFSKSLVFGVFRG